MDSIHSLCHWTSIACCVDILKCGEMRTPMSNYKLTGTVRSPGNGDSSPAKYCPYDENNGIYFSLLMHDMSGPISPLESPDMYIIVPKEILEIEIGWHYNGSRFHSGVISEKSVLPAQITGSQNIYEDLLECNKNYVKSDPVMNSGRFERDTGEVVFHGNLKTSYIAMICVSEESDRETLLKYAPPHIRIIVGMPTEEIDFPLRNGSMVTPMFFNLFHGGKTKVSIAKIGARLLNDLPKFNAVKTKLLEIEESEEDVVFDEESILELLSLAIE